MPLSAQVGLHGVFTGNWCANPTPRTNSEIWIVTEKSLKIQDQRDIVKENIYDVEGRIEAVARRISTSDKISNKDRKLIFDFCSHCRLQGLAKIMIFGSVLARIRTYHKSRKLGASKN